jgi:hypothetical protein
MDKFMGKPKAQKAAATGEVEVSDEETLGEMSEGSEDMETVAANTITLTQLVEQQKILAEQITALRDQDF